MANTIGLVLLCMPFVLLIALASVLLAGNLVHAFAHSDHAWIATVLLLPHIATKQMDRIYDACIAGRLLEAAVQTLPLLAIIVALKYLLAIHEEKRDGKKD